MSMTLDLSSSSSPSSPPERVCYVHCNFCNTILAVSVPCSSMLGIVTVRCGHCANLLSVNMGALLHTVPLLQDHHLQLQVQKQQWMSTSEEAIRNYYYCSGSSSVNKSPSLSFGGSSSEHDQPAPRTPPIRPPEKRQRVPSAYNRFIKEEIQRIKTSNPDMSHREAFSTAAKNWAHFPNIHFGQNQQTATDDGDRGTSTSTTSQGSNNSSLFF